MENPTHSNGNTSVEIEDQKSFQFNPIAPVFTMDSDLFSSMSPKWTPPGSNLVEDSDLFTKMTPVIKGDILPLIFEPGRMGLRVEDNIITYVFPDTQAEKMGVVVGWRILQVNGMKQPPDSVVIDEAIDLTYKAGQPTKIVFCTEPVDIPSLSLDEERFTSLGEDHFSDTVSSLSDEKKKKSDLFSKFYGMSVLSLGGVSSSLSLLGDPDSLGRELKARSINPALTRMQGHNPKAAPFIPKGVELHEDSDLQQDLFSSMSPRWKGCNPNAPEFVPQLPIMPELDLGLSANTMYPEVTPRAPEIHNPTENFLKPPPHIEILVTFQPGRMGFKIEGNCIIKVFPKTQAKESRIGVGWIIIAVNGNLQTNDTLRIEKAIEETSKLKKPTDILFRKTATDIVFPAHFHYTGTDYQANGCKLQPGDLIEYNTTKGWRNGKILSVNSNGTFQIERWNKKVGHKWKPFNIRIDISKTRHVNSTQELLRNKDTASINGKRSLPKRGLQMLPGDHIEYKTTKGWRDGKIMSVNADGTYEIERWTGTVGHQWMLYNIRPRKQS